MLGRDWTIRAFNSQNQTITVNIEALPWKFVSGVKTWGTEITTFNSTITADNQSSTETWTDNSTDAYIGADLTVTFTAGTTTDGTGTVALYLHNSNDDQTTVPDAATTGDDAPCGIFVGAYTVTAADTTGAVVRNFQIG